MEKENLLQKFESRSFQEFYFFAIALILAFGTLQTAGTVLDTDKPVVTVVSCSMYPEYSAGDILLVQGQEFGELERGDIVVYDVPPRLEFTVQGESYVLEGSGDSVSTPAGEVELRDVRINSPDRSNDVALVTVNGLQEKIKEDSSSNLNGVEIRADYVTKMDIPIVHRVISRSETSLETRGDNNRGQLEFESNVRQDQIHGTVLFSVPRIGLVKLLTMDFVGFSGPGDQPLVLDRIPKCVDRT